MNRIIKTKLLKEFESGTDGAYAKKSIRVNQGLAVAIQACKAVPTRTIVSNGITMMAPNKWVVALIGSFEGVSMLDNLKDEL